VVNFHLLALSVLLALPFPIAARVEKAFLQNSPQILRELMTAEGTIPVSLPEPLSLADQLSPDQAYLVFGRIFSVFKTTEFTTDPQLSSLPGLPGAILKARWSFQNERTGDQYPLRIYFFVVVERRLTTAGGPGPGIALKIVEIRAEKL
jgi:hypothetical protein